jgi:hypothetical protein
MTQTDTIQNNKPMKTILKFILITIIAVTITPLTTYLVCNQAKEKTPTHDLEIYTEKNIYYIKDLTVTDEVGIIHETFKTNKELKEFISDITVKDAQAGFNCLDLISNKKQL